MIVVEPQGVSSARGQPSLGPAPIDVGLSRDYTPSHRESTPVSIAVDPVALINTECITVTSAMRKHARWAHSSVSAILGGGASSTYRGPYSIHTQEQDGKSRINGTVTGIDVISTEEGGLAHRWGLGIRGKNKKSLQDNPLMSAFARLRSDIRGCTGTYGLSRIKQEY